MKFPLISLVVSALGLSVAACNIVAPAQSDPTRNYVLSGSAPNSETADHTPSGSLRIGLKTVTLPGYLKSHSIVVRTGANELVMPEFARWAEPLDAGIARIVRSYLAQAPAVARVYSEPFPFDADRAYDVVVTLVRCEGAIEANGRAAARFEAQIEIAKPDGNGQIVARRWFVAHEGPWDGKDFGQLAGLLSHAAEDLGREIVSALPPSP